MQNVEKWTIYYLGGNRRGEMDLPSSSLSLVETGGMDNVAVCRLMMRLSLTHSSRVEVAPFRDEIEEQTHY